MNRYQEATIESVHALAQNELKRERSVVVYGVPGAKTINDVPRSEHSPSPTPEPRAIAGQEWRSNPPAPGPSHALRLPVPKKFDFPNGIPKIHEHDGKPAQGFGLIYEGRLVCFYDYQCDLGDGWEDEEVHHDTPEIRLKALQMGANLIQYVFNQ